MKLEEFEFVNEGPAGQRCEFTFVVDEHLNWPRRVFSTRGKKCGLERDPTSTQGYCYWHKTDPDKSKDVTLREKLEEAVRQRAYLGGAFLSGGGPGTRLAGSYGPIDLSGAKLNAAYLTGAYLEGTSLKRAMLREAHLDEAWLGSADLSGADLSGAHLWRTDFQFATLTGADLWDAEISSSTRLDEVNWGKDYVLASERAGKFDRASATYRMLKQHRQESGDYHTAGEFYFREMECVRKQLTGHHRLVWMLFYKSICGYGERPTWTFRWAVGVILIWGCLVLPLFGIRNPDGSITRLSWPPSLITFQHGLSLSLITFATLGYGNRYPIGPVGEFLAGCEALLGMLLGSIFVVSFAKKVIRG